MGFIHLCAVALIALAVQATQAQCVNCRRQLVPTRTYITRERVPQPAPTCSCSTSEDLNKLILLAKMLIEKNSDQAATNQINAEAIIKRLIDALIYTTLQYNNCRAVLDKVSGGTGGGNTGGTGGGNTGGTGGGNTGGTGGGNTGGTSGGTSGGNKGSGGNGNPLIDLDLLNPNSPNNVLGLDLAGQDILGLGLGNNKGSGSSIKGAGGTESSPSPSRPNQPDNVLDVGLGGNNLLGVGLGNTDGSGSNGATPSSSGSGSNSVLGLDLLNPSSPSNVLGLEALGQNILGVGLGDPK